MTLIILNQTANQRSYLAGNVILSASGYVNVNSSLTFAISRDATLISDCNNSIVMLSDGVNTYSAGNAISYLNQIASSIGGVVVGLAGSSAPNYSITIGGKDPNGNSIVGSYDGNGNLKVSDAAVNYSQYQNVTGNTTSTIKSGSGILNNIMINRNWTGGTVVVYDSLSGSGTKIATIDFGTPSGGLLTTTGLPSPILLGPLGLAFSTGLTVVTSGSTNNDITVIYQ